MTKCTSKVSIVLVVSFPISVYVCVLSGVWENMGDFYYVPLLWYMIKIC